jgi:hypothetical protein
VVVVKDLLVASSVLRACSKGLDAFLPNCTDHNRLSSLQLAYSAELSSRRLAPDRVRKLLSNGGTMA